MKLILTSVVILLSVYLVNSAHIQSWGVVNRDQSQYKDVYYTAEPLRPTEATIKFPDVITEFFNFEKEN